MKNRGQCPQIHLMCVSLLLALTIQTAIVVLPVRAHSVLFTDKHHFSHTHLHQPSTLQGTAHTEQFLKTNRCGVQTQPRWIIAEQQHSAHHWISNTTTGYKQTEPFTHNYVFLSDPWMQVVHCYFCPLQRTESRLERNMGTTLVNAYTMTTADLC